MNLLRRRPRPLADLRYFAALLGRFRITLIFAAVLFVAVPPVYVWFYVGPAGERIGFGEATHHVYFLLFGQPSLPYVDNLLLEALNVLVPPAGLAFVVDGIVRFAYLYFAKQRDDKEWVAVLTKGFQKHIIVCGAGRVGFRVATQLLQLGKEVVVLEKDDKSPFVSTLRDMNVPVLIDNVTNPNALSRTNVTEAVAIVCATNDDLANLNVALDARRMNPRIRVVARMFDEDLGERVRDNFQADALSTSALSAPAMALTALDPRIIHSFHVGDHLMVVSEFVAGAALAKLTVRDLRDRYGALTLAIARPKTASELHPPGTVGFAASDVATVQASYTDYLALRAVTQEVEPPLSGGRNAT